MVFECLEVGSFETLLFISIFLQCFELVCGWLQTKVVVCLLLTCFSNPPGLMQVGQQQQQTRNKEQAASKNATSNKEELI